MYTCVCACVIGVAVPVLTSLNYELICLSMQLFSCSFVYPFMYEVCTCVCMHVCA